MLMTVIPRIFTELYLHNVRQTRADYSVDYVANINADEAPCVAYMYSNEHLKRDSLSKIIASHKNSF